jgi:hypothetical protein
MTTETGLNDAKHIIWALGTYFFPLCVFWYTYYFLGSIYVLKGQIRERLIMDLIINCS